MNLYQIQSGVEERTSAITAARPDWPCRKGCDDCCRHLASVPVVTAPEWRLIADALDALPSATADAARRRIAGSASATRPVVCPLLDTASGGCLVYNARPVACRAYGFYAERESVLGCYRIEAIASEPLAGRHCAGGAASNEVIWGNHLALEDRLGLLGKSAPLSDWLEG